MKHGPKPGRRFPFEPLYSFLSANPTPWVTDAELASRRPSAAQLAALIGVHSFQVSRWRSAGMTAAAADRVAIALGLHPLNVWPDFYDDLDEAS